MDIAIVAVAAFVASGLTFFSGFGLGTLLLPIFAVFFSLPAAIALTALVHLLNNLFKLSLIGRHADKGAVLRFGLPAMAAAFVGARILEWLSDLEPVVSYNFLSRACEVTPINLVIASLMVSFALFELIPRFENVTFERRFLPVGGILSGFFGGLSGHQGALRSAFLIKCGLSKEEFIATGVVIACLVDVTRITVYARDFPALSGHSGMILHTAVLSAFMGAFLGSRFIHKVTMRAVRRTVSVMLLAIALGLGSGII